MQTLWQTEEALTDGAAVVCGVDEAGRGPLAGPVCAAACILPKGFAPEGLNDSKKLSEKQRERLYAQITEHALAWSVSLIDEQTIDRVNILQATFLAMRSAVEGLSVRPELCLVDGNQDPGLGVKTLTVVHGDARCASVAAASILAKVTRDRLMLELAEKYPQYGFEKHKGYGTKAHYEALRQYGPCPIHRMSFLKSFQP